MSYTDQPNSRPRRGGGRSQGRTNHRPHGSRSPHHSDRSERQGQSDRTPREDHRDWEPVDRGRDIRRRAAEQPSLFQKILSTITFGLLGGKKKPAAKSAPPAKNAKTAKTGERPERPARESRPPREARPPRERQSSPPNPDAVTSPRLHVGNLSYDAAGSDLTDLFSGAGQVQSVEVVYHRDTQRSKGFAFVQMLTTEEAKRAVSELHGKDYMGRKMEIGPARAPGQGRDNDRR